MNAAIGARAASSRAAGRPPLQGHGEAIIVIVEEGSATGSPTTLFEVREGDTFEDLRSTVAERWHLPTEAVRLRFNGMELVDETNGGGDEAPRRMLYDIGVMSGTTIVAHTSASASGA